MELLKPPQSPLSAVATTISWVSSAPVPDSIFGAPPMPPKLSAMEPTMRSMRAA